MSIHSDRKTWLTKLDRIGKIARNDNCAKFNNLMHVIDRDLLLKHYKKLDGKKALGIDNISKHEYGKDLDVNITQLIRNIHKDNYCPKPAKIVKIPKEDGSSRPLAISCFEDKLIQSAASEILSSIYEPIFIACSYGFRPDKNAHQALKELNRLTYEFTDGAIVEIDISKYFNTIPHKEIRKFLKQKISDRKFLRLLQRLIEAPIIEEGYTAPNKIGCPQGSIISPILANIYLHYVIDQWFVETKEQYLEGKAGMVRYADDMVFVFEREQDAERFYKSLPKRLNKYGLMMHGEKSQIMKSGKYQAEKAAKSGEKLASYNFLGFTCYWGKSRNGNFWRLKYTSRKDRYTAKLKGLKKYLKDNLASKDKSRILSTVIKVVQGWINYHAISDNQKRVSSFIYQCKHILFKWFNRMGGKIKLNWQKFFRILERTNFPTNWKIISMF